MSHYLPIIEELIDAPDDAARARWLLTVPLSVLIREQVTINRLLSKAGFLEGVAYLDAEVTALCATRGVDGLASPTVLMGRNYARIGIVVTARGRTEEASEGDAA